MAWTKQQNDAINVRNSSVIVSAAAGSGKTAVLTERLAQILADKQSGVQADRIIVVTFTNDASSELKKRLDAKLRTLIAENPGDTHLLKQQTLLQSARISTINSFCFELLRDNITDEGITSSFTVLDESENLLIKKQALDELINYYSSKKYKDISLLYDKFCLKNDEKLAEVIETADRFLSSASMRDKWLEKAEEQFETAPEKSVYYQILVKNSIENARKALSIAENCRDMLDDIIEESDEAPFSVKSYEQADDDLKIIKALLDILEKGVLPDEENSGNLTQFSRLVTAGKNAQLNKELRELYKARRKEFIEIIRKTMTLSYGFNEDFYECKEIVKILTQMLRKYNEIVWEHKCRKNAISFDDGERLALELLADFDENGNIIQSESAQRISENFDIIMIDEYQDSNNKQDLIFKLISKGYRHNEQKLPMYGKNAFVVGDVKQSIYRFRLANPGNFINTIADSDEYFEGLKSDNYAMTLNKNFRSSESVIDYVNFVFSQLMTSQCGDVDYNHKERLNFGASEYSGATESIDMKTQIAFVNEELYDEEDNPEAEYTADKISEMINSKAMVVTKSGLQRPCEPSDFCILIRNNKKASEYVKALKDRGISAKGEEEEGYLTSREIAILLDLLRIIDNPLLDIPMMAVMMSPMFMFELEEIAYIKSLSKKKFLFTVISSLVRGKYKKCENEFLIERCRRFLKTIDEFRLCSVTMTISELIEQIYDVTDYISVMQLCTDGDKKRANLRILIQYAKNYEGVSNFEGSGGLCGFLRYIDRIIESGADLTQGKVSSSTGNYVSVKTIHKSKGLEYPFIFLTETSTPIRFDNPTIVCTDDSRIGFVLNNPELMRRYKTVPYKQIVEEKKREIISEELRLLYVALTRAKQQLFINIKYNERRNKALTAMLENYNIYNCDIKEASCKVKCHADWILLSLFETNVFSEILYKLNINCEAPVIKYKTSDLLEIVYPERCESESQEDHTFLEEPSADMKIVEELTEILDYSYDMSLTDTPAKLSVTQIAKKMGDGEETVNLKLKRPKFIREGNQLTGAEKGTAIHTFFQYCDFEKASENPEEEIKRSVENGYISLQQGKSISKRNVNAFFRSKMYKRIMNSEQIWREKKFTVAVSELKIENDYIESLRNSAGMIKGIVDLVFEENGKLILVDYKSDKRCSEQTLKERYKLQLELYKSAIELTTGKKVSEAYLYSFELKKEIKLDI